MSARAAMHEVLITDGIVEATLLPQVGARFHRLRAFGHDLMRTPSDTQVHRDDPFFWGGYVMAPWCNRIEAAPTRVGDRLVDLAPNFRDGTAIHGQVYATPWERQGDGSFRTEGGGDGWPWTYEVGLDVRIVGATVRIDQTLVNRSSDPMPGGIGIHPWFLRPVQVAIQGHRVHASNLETAPEPEPVEGPLDLRELREMDDDLDAAWADISEPPVELAWPSQGVRATMRFTAPSRFVIAASPAEIDAVAVEPETHAPHALRRLLNGEPGGLAWLAPGETLRLTTELAFERIS